SANAAMRLLRVHLIVVDPEKRSKCGKGKAGSHEEYGLRRQKMAARPHDEGGRPVSCRGEAGIAAKALRKRGPPDQAEAYGRDCWTEKRARHGVQAARQRDDHKDR